ncbi:putative pam16 [Lyophyllum shimeji]|uniref:Mitochondrial import inner membrane translocase subunit TIM16 n=1 Tax=Lyophyllum shimeji TaxID=47721 RepID=A0A9P3UJM8_LYOSH|nr:putative pam16 [Lyophyllum shimeji]
MASPKVLVQILVTGTRILGKAFYEAGRQAVKNAKHSPQGALGNDVAGVGTATSGSPTDQITRAHRMTLDEAHLILNVKREASLENVLKNYEHLFKANSPLPAPTPEKAARGKAPAPAHSHYLQSKVVRARERIEAELKLASETPLASAAEAPVTPGATQAPPPPHEMPGGGKS